MQSANFATQEVSPTSDRHVHDLGGEPGVEIEALRARLLGAEEEVQALRRRLQESPGRAQALEERLLEVRGQLAHAVSQNEKLTFTLQQAKEQLATLREEVEKLTQPPAAYGTFLAANDDETVDVFSGGRKMRVALHPDIVAEALQKGDEVVLNESLNVVLVRQGEKSGEVVTLKEVLADARRVLVFARADEERVAELSDGMIGEHLRAGDALLMDSRTQLVIERLPRPEVEELVLEEVPDITYADVGGCVLFLASGLSSFVTGTSLHPDGGALASSGCRVAHRSTVSPPMEFPARIGRSISRAARTASSSSARSGSGSPRGELAECPWLTLS